MHAHGLSVVMHPMTSRDPMTSLMTSSRNNLCHNFWAKYLGKWNKARHTSSGMVPMDSLWESAHGLSFRHHPDDVSWHDEVIMATSWFFCKMLLLRQCRLWSSRISRLYDVIAASEANRLLACNRVFEYQFELWSFWSSY